MGSSTSFWSVQVFPSASWVTRRVRNPDTAPRGEILGAEPSRAVGISVSALVLARSRKKDSFPAVLTIIIVYLMSSYSSSHLRSRQGLEGDRVASGPGRPSAFAASSALPSSLFVCGAVIPRPSASRHLLSPPFAPSKASNSQSLERYPMLRSFRVPREQLESRPPTSASRTSRGTRSVRTTVRPPSVLPRASLHAALSLLHFYLPCRTQTKESEFFPISFFRSGSPRSSIYDHQPF